MISHPKKNVLHQVVLIPSPVQHKASRDEKQFKVLFIEDFCGLSLHLIEKQDANEGKVRHVGITSCN